MQIYYFTRTGRSKEIAEQLAELHHITARVIEDHKNWAGKINYLKAGAMAFSGRSVPAEYDSPDLQDDIVVVFPLWAGAMPPAVKTFVEAVGREHITAVVTSLGSVLKQRDGFKKVIDLVGKEIAVPDDKLLH